MRVAQFAFLDTRVTLFANRLRPFDEIRELVDAPPELYGAVIGTLGLEPRNGDGASFDSAALEQALISHIMADFARIVRSLSGPIMQLLAHWALRFELSNLKAVVRAKLTGQTLPALRRELVDIRPYDKLPLNDLSEAEDVPELLRILERVRGYGPLAREARRIFAEKPELFALDTALDRRYYALAIKRATAITGPEGLEIRRLAELLVDRINLVWLLRYRFSYDLAPAEAYYLLVPAGAQVDRGTLRHIAQSTTLEEAISRVPDRLRQRIGDAQTISQVAQRLRHYHWAVAEQILDRTRFNPARAYAYLILKERESRYLRTVIKGRELGLERGLIHDALSNDADGLPLGGGNV